MSRDLVELWNALELREVDLVGHSMGSVVALITAATDRRIRRLVLSGVGRYQVEYDGGPLPHFDAAGLAAALEAEDSGELHDQPMQRFRRRIAESGNDRLALAAHLRAFHTDPFDFDRITARTLVIAGEDDVLSPEPARLAAAMPNAGSLTLPGDHNESKNTREFFEALVGFLDGGP